jgi:amino acid adenylation domain-containing protein
MSQIEPIPGTDHSLGAKRKLLEKILRGEVAQGGKSLPPIGPRSSGGPFPLSYAQEQVWFHAQMAPDLPVYHEPTTVHRRGPLDGAVLERCLVEIIRRHEAWRTTFDVVNGELVQIVHPAPASFKIPFADLRHLPEPERQAEALRLATEDARRRFDLKRGPLVRAFLVRLAGDEYRLFLTFHHIILDGISIYRVVMPELAALYEAFSRGKPSPLPDPTLQYADFVLWQRQWIRGGYLAEHMAYWRKQLAGELPALELPTDRSRPPLQTYRGANQLFKFDKRLTDRMKDLSQREGVSLFMILLASFQTLLHRYSGQDDILVGTVTAGRHHSQIENLVGLFLSTVPLRTDFSGNPSFRELLGQVREVTLAALLHDQVPFEHLVKELPLRRDPSRTPIFQAMMALEPPLAKGNQGWDMTVIDVDTGATKVDLCPHLDERLDGIHGRFIYNRDLFDASTILRMIGHWQGLLACASADPNQRVGDLPLLTEAERQQVLVEWNDTAMEYPRNLCLHQMFEAQVERAPDACALIFKDKSVTYAELNRRANQLAWRLAKHGVGPEVAVGICAERSIEMIVGLLSILKAGGACLPLDPEYPKERLAFMLQDGRVQVLLVDPQFLERLPETEANIVRLDTDFESAETPGKGPPSRVSPDNLAYIIYTSGSTGKPKGVEVAHRGILRLLCGVDYVDLDKTKAVLQLAAFTFDGSIFDIWGALLHGARSVLYPGRVPMVRELGDLLRKHRVTTAWLTSSLFNAVVDEDSSVLASLEQLLVGGEALSVSHIRRAWDHLPNVEIINGYGPTEATVFACSYLIRSKPDATATSIPIGRPIGNTRAYILDRNLQPVPIGVNGELYLGGPGVARGYRNRPELTAEKFIPDPFSKDPGARLYKTGDLARYLAGGNIDFLGRIDDQVKVRGFRIELGEIEATLRRHEGVRDAAVLLHTDSHGEKRLSAFVAREPATALSAEEVLRFLRQELPEFMVPSRCCVMDRLPMTSSGKVDRQVLAAMCMPVGEISSATVPPRTSLEKELVQIWEQLLDVRPVGIRDNFFDLGGHSLLAIRLIAKIEETFGKRLPVAALLGAPTIEQLAALLGQDDSRERLAYAVAIQPKGEEPPFFCVGAGPLLRPLSVQLGPGQPFFSLGLEPEAVDRFNAPYQLEKLAEYLVSALRERQPEGPYYLGGFCHDGIFAYEVARQLKLQGQDVGLLALFETVNPSPNTKVRIATGVKRTVIRLGLRRSQLIRLKIRELPRYILSQIEPLKLVMRRLFRSQPRPPDLERILYFAASHYKPKPLACPTVLFRCTEWPIASAGDPYLGWRHLLTGWSETYQVPGDHTGMFGGTNVEVLAEQVRACLRTAKQTDTCTPKRAAFGR